MKNQSINVTPQPERAVVVHVELPAQAKDVVAQPHTERKIEEKLSEAMNLASALGLEIVRGEIVQLKKISPKTLMGKGKLEELHHFSEEGGVGLFIINTPLTPGQQRNLEVELNAKVIDRTHLILEIFADRARTKAGRLQVALAHETYMQGRLVRAWTHLERQRGGMGKTGGPGERQIELDRRMIRDRIKLIKRDLESVEKERELQRKERQRNNVPVISLVGYTNAGKSSLFNALLFYGQPKEKQEAIAKDMLFATLDPLMRKMKLPHGRDVILSDTVGFVSDLPHELVEAFSSTLEEVKQADLLLQVEDISSNEHAAQAEDVRKVLEEIEAQDIPRLHVLNKADLLEEEELPLEVPQGAVLTSAVKGQGIEQLLMQIEDFLNQGSRIEEFQVSAADGKKRAWLHNNTEVLSEELEGETWHIKARVSGE